MSFERFTLIAFGLGTAFVLVALVRALRTGRCGYGRAAVLRADDPAGFWHAVASAAALPPVFAVMLFDSRLASAVLQILFGLSVAYYPVRWLRTGEAGWEHAMFSRSEEPREYWLLVLAVAAAIAAASALAAATLAQALEA